MFSRLLRKTTSLSQPFQRFSFASATQGGNLYTWGQRSAGLGVSIASTSNALATPQLIEDFDNNVARAVMGPTHSAVVTTQGDLYTFGYCQYGVLGHNERDVSSYTPRLVSYFGENNLRVKDVVVGAYHTAALTEDGDVYSWGWGGKSVNPLKNIAAPSYGALGLGTNADRYVPTLIEDLREAGNVTNFTSGFGFCAFLNGSNDVYHWGEGSRGVFAEENHRNLKSPTLNEAARHISEEEGAKIIKIRACANHVLALLDNGVLYGWGNNALGQLGIKKEVGIELYENIFEPTRFNDRKIQGKKVVDFDVGQEITAILTDSGEVYWFGLKLALEPEPINFPKGIKIKKIAVTNPCVTVVTENNEVYTSDKLIRQADEDPHTGIYKVRGDAFNGGQVLDIGGQYVNKFAIVRS